MWNIFAVENPQQCQDMNWSPRRSYEKEMKDWCTDEFNLLESIERIEEGENFEDVDLHPEMLTQCLEYDNRAKNRSGFNPDSAYDYLAQGYGSGYPLHPPHPQHSTFYQQSFETVLPSIEKDSDDENDKFNDKTGKISAYPAYAPTRRPLRYAALPSLPIRQAQGLRSHPARAGTSALMMPSKPVLGQSDDSEFLDVDKLPPYIEVIDLTGDEHPTQPRKEEHQRVSAHNHHQLSTPRIKLTAAGLAQKRLRDPSATPFGRNGDPKRRKIESEDQKGGAHEELFMGLQRFRTDPAVLGRAMPENAVDSDEGGEEDENDDQQNGGYRVGSV
jgi:hypothetical protein